tara:strand:+ start:12003 stop:12563 length:561 start_codon:yes stop_codon:yes gene_type:complete
MKIYNTEIRDIKIIKPNVFEDERGFFMESFRSDFLQSNNINIDFIQENHSKSSKDVIRGLHFQWDKPLSKLIRITRGEAFVVALDIRLKSKTFGQHVGKMISEHSKEQLWVPFGFATGFCACSNIVEVQYKCNAYYNPNAESGINPFDKDLNIDWPITKNQALLSEKDAKAKSLKEWVNTNESNAF